MGGGKNSTNRGHSYHRANVLLYDLVGETSIQTDLLGEVDTGKYDAEQARLKAFDAINARYGKTTIRYAAEDLSDAWLPKHGMRSPRYTSNWDELPTLKLG